MSLDPPFTAEFANAGYLADIPDDAQTTKLEEQSFEGATAAATWDGEMVVAPVLGQHAGAVVPQVLRREGRARHEPAGDVGPDHRRGRGERRQGRRPGQQVRGLLGLDQRPDRRAPAATSSPTPSQGADAKLDMDSEAGRRGRRDHREAGRLAGRSAPTSRSPTRAPPVRPSAPTRRRSWSTGPTSGPTTTRRSPRSKDGPRLHPLPAVRGGRGVPSAVRRHRHRRRARTATHNDEAMQAVECLTYAENQGVNAELTGNMPASEAGYEYPALEGDLPAGAARPVPGERRRRCAPRP